MTDPRPQEGFVHFSPALSLTSLSSVSDPHHIASFLAEMRQCRELQNTRRELDTLKEQSEKKDMQLEAVLKAESEQQLSTLRKESERQLSALREEMKEVKALTAKEAAHKTKIDKAKAKNTPVCLSFMCLPLLI